MKTTQKSILFAGLLLAAAGTLNQAQADDHHRDGFRDHHGRWHDHYDYYHSHRGYWDEQNGVRIFINL
jgi:hypothetical protein